MADAVKTVTASDTQGDLTRNTETFIHTSNGNEKVTHSSNRNLEQKIMSNWTLHIVVPTMHPRIYQNWTKGCIDCISATDTFDICDEESRRGRGVGRRMS